MEKLHDSCCIASELVYQQVQQLTVGDAHVDLGIVEILHAVIMGVVGIDAHRVIVHRINGHDHRCIAEEVVQSEVPVVVSVYPSMSSDIASASVYASI